MISLKWKTRWPGFQNVRNWGSASKLTFFPRIIRFGIIQLLLPKLNFQPVVVVSCHDRYLHLICDTLWIFCSPSLFPGLSCSSMNIWLWHSLYCESNLHFVLVCLNKGLNTSTQIQKEKNYLLVFLCHCYKRVQIKNVMIININIFLLEKCNWLSY